jgi:hypothetical protein
MKVKFNVHEFIEENASTYNGQLRVSAGIELEELFGSIPEEEEIDVDIHELLAENRQIAHIWGIDDVQQQRPDLDEDQAWAVLQAAAKRLDSNYGITWDTLKILADELYPDEPKRHWQGRIDVRITDTDGYGQDEVLTRLRDMADLLARDMPDVKADVDTGAIRLFDSDETASQSGGTHEA